MVAIRRGKRRGTGMHLRTGQPPDSAGCSRPGARVWPGRVRRSGPGSTAGPKAGLQGTLGPCAPVSPPVKLSGMATLVLLRHGESEWNAKGLFTGWVDVGLSERGATEASSGGTLLRDSGVLPDRVHTSVLTRAIQTANLALGTAGLLWLPVRRSWRLNERHYGAL